MYQKWLAELIGISAVWEYRDVELAVVQVKNTVIEID